MFSCSLVPSLSSFLPLDDVSYSSSSLSSSSSSSFSSSSSSLSSTSSFSSPLIFPQYWLQVVHINDRRHARITLSPEIALGLCLSEHEDKHYDAMSSSTEVTFDFVRPKLHIALTMNRFSSQEVLDQAMRESYVREDSIFTHIRTQCYACAYDKTEAKFQSSLVRQEYEDLQKKSEPAKKKVEVSLLRTCQYQTSSSGSRSSSSSGGGGGGGGRACIKNESEETKETKEYETKKSASNTRKRTRTSRLLPWETQDEQYPSSSSSLMPMKIFVTAPLSPSSSSLSKPTHFASPSPSLSSSSSSSSSSFSSSSSSYSSTTKNSRRTTTTTTTTTLLSSGYSHSPAATSPDRNKKKTRTEKIKHGETIGSTDQRDSYELLAWPPLYTTDIHSVPIVEKVSVDICPVTSPTPYFSSLKQLQDGVIGRTIARVLPFVGEYADNASGPGMFGFELYNASSSSSSSLYRQVSSRSPSSSLPPPQSSSLSSAPILGKKKEDSRLVIGVFGATRWMRLDDVPLFEDPTDDFSHIVNALTGLTIIDAQLLDTGSVQLSLRGRRHVPGSLTGGSLQRHKLEIAMTYEEATTQYMLSRPVYETMFMCSPHKRIVVVQMSSTSLPLQSPKSISSSSTLAAIVVVD